MLGSYDPFCLCMYQERINDGDIAYDVDADDIADASVATTADVVAVFTYAASSPPSSRCGFP